MVHDVAAVLWLQSIVHVMLFPMIKVLYFTLLLSEIWMQCLTWLFSAVPYVVLSPYIAQEFSEWFSDGPVAPTTIKVITFVFTFYIRCICIVKSLHFRIFPASFFITFPSPDTAMSVNTHFPFLLSRITLSSLLLWTLLSVFTCWTYNMVILTS